MKQLFTLFVLAVSLQTTAQPLLGRVQNGSQPTTSTPSASQQRTPSRTQPGLFGVVHQGKEWFLEIPDSLLKRELLVTVRYTSTPAGYGKYGGEQVNQQTMYWEKTAGGDIRLRSKLIVTVANQYDAIGRAVEANSSNPVIAVFKPETNATRGTTRVNVSNFFLSDNGTLTLSRIEKQILGVQGMITNLSEIETIKSFPLNTEVRLLTTWSAPQGPTPSSQTTGKVTVGLNISFVLLPKTEMPRRLFDPRVGYFTDQYTEFSDYQQHVEPRRFITRWRLEPKDSADRAAMMRGELVEPKQPIIYYIDPATPKRWRPYLIKGVEDWQVAFEAAGFKNAIQAREWPENDSTMSMEDARFSVIRYLASPIENAYGPNVHDPRTGQILESHICWYHNVMQLLHDWYMVQAATLDEAARAMRFDDELMGELIRFVSSHEVGHTLGLRHNFGSSSTVPVDSLRDKAWVEAHGHTPSIMDYARFNYVAQPTDGISRKGIFPRIGDYDIWAIRWGYTPMWEAFDEVSDHRELETNLMEKYYKGNRRLWFGDGESRRSDPRCQTEDLGDDPVKAGNYGIANLKWMLPQLPAWSYDLGDVNNTYLADNYNTVRSQLRRYLNHAVRYIGGTFTDFKAVHELGATYRPTPLDMQKRVLEFLDEQVLNEPKWLIEVPYIDRLTSNPLELTLAVGRPVVQQLISEGQLLYLNTEYPADQYLKDLTAMVFKELTTGQDPTEYRKGLQRTYVNGLTSYFKDAGADARPRAAVLFTLKSLQKQLEKQQENAHYAALSDAIERVLKID
ncbi:MAG: zinc-dependent metalloprotease [Bacteroidaceae bacterium]|nr:zinc-dependent metalloprotease [Bacteroidaceae bacterium]